MSDLSRDDLTLRQIIADIDLKRADMLRKQQEVRLAPWQIGLTAGTTVAAAFAAGGAFIKLFG